MPRRSAGGRDVDRRELDTSRASETLAIRSAALARCLAHAPSRLKHTAHLLRLQRALDRWALFPRPAPHWQPHLTALRESTQAKASLRPRARRSAFIALALRWADGRKYGALLRWRCACLAIRLLSARPPPGTVARLWTPPASNEEVLRDLLREVVVMKAAVAAVVS
jgi:hypothetical protein